MKAKLTSKGQITIPYRIRKKLNLQPGQELEFDESTPYLKATRVVDERAARSVIGTLKDIPKNSSQILNDLRGKVE